MILASQMSYKLGFIDATAFELYEDALSHFLLPAAAVDQFLSKLSFPEILHEARQDKKNSNNILTMVLPVAYRKVEIQEIDLSLCGGAW
jgi:3-dehydroquinate synthetase